MVIDENKLREQLSSSFVTEVVDKVIGALKIQGLPVAVTPGSFDLEIGEDVSIKFLGPDGNPPVKGDIIRSWCWEAKIGELDPRRVKAIRIPELSYDDTEVLAIDVTVYPFIIKSLFSKGKKDRDIVDKEATIDIESEEVSPK